MLSLLRRNLALVNAILSATSSIPLAIWINLLTSNDRPKWILGNSLDYIFPVATLILLAVQYYIIRRLGGLTRETAEGIRGVLRFGVEILAARAGVDDRQVRGHCHCFEKGKLVPKAYFTWGFQKDSAIEIPVSDNWFIICKAFVNDDVCCNNADWNKPSDLSREIWEDIRGVIACSIKPLPDPANPISSRSQPIGVISFDSSRTYEQMKWARRKGEKVQVTPEIREAMMAIAAAAHNFMTKDLGNG